MGPYHGRSTAMSCSACGAAMEASALSCPGCRRLTHSAELEDLAKRAGAAWRIGDFTLERTLWAQSLAAPARGHGAAPDHSGAHRRDRSAALGIGRHAAGEPLAAEARHGRGGIGPLLAPRTDQGQVPAARPDQDGNAAHHAGLARRLLGDLRLGVRARPRGLHLHPRDGPRRRHSPLRFPRQRAHVHPRLRRLHPIARRPPAAHPGSPRRACRTPLRLRRGGGGARLLLRHSRPDLGRHRPLRRGHQLLQPDSRMAVGWFARLALADAYPARHRAGRRIRLVDDHIASHAAADLRRVRLPYVHQRLADRARPRRTDAVRRPAGGPFGDRGALRRHPPLFQPRAEPRLSAPPLQRTG